MKRFKITFAAGVFSMISSFSGACSHALDEHFYSPGLSQQDVTTSSNLRDPYPGKKQTDGADTKNLIKQNKILVAEKYYSDYLNHAFAFLSIVGAPSLSDEENDLYWHIITDHQTIADLYLQEAKLLESEDTLSKTEIEELVVEREKLILKASQDLRRLIDLRDRETTVGVSEPSP